MYVLSIFIFYIIEKKLLIISIVKVRVVLLVFRVFVCVLGLFVGLGWVCSVDVGYLD